MNTGSTASSTARGPVLPSTRPVMSAAAAAPTTETASTAFFSVSEKPPRRVMYTVRNADSVAIASE